MSEENLNEMCECETKADLEEEIRMYFIFDDAHSYHEKHMFREVQEKIEREEPQLLYVFFDMGSVILNTGNPSNHIIVSHEHVEIYNNETMETTFIRCEKINGFVFEPIKEESKDEEI